MAEHNVADLNNPLQELNEQQIATLHQPCETKLQRKNTQISNLKEKIKYLSLQSFHKSTTPWEELANARSQNTRKRRLTNFFQNAAENLPPDIKRVKVILETEGGTEIEIEAKNVPISIEEKRIQKENEEKRVTAYLQVKDEFLISDEASNELAQLKGTNIPPLSQVKKARTLQNAFIAIHEMPHEFEGECAYRSVTEVITKYILKLDQTKQLLANGQSPQLLFKFSSDGAKLTKRFSGVKGAISLVNPRNVQHSHKGTVDDECIIYMYKGDESYEAQQKAANVLFEEMKTIQENGIVVNGTQINIKWMVVCDWKAAAILMGLNGAASNYFCLWCYCQKTEIYDFSIDSWSVQRSLASAQMLLRKENDTRGHIYQPLLPIEFDQLVIDTLHMFIRIMGKLLDQVIVWALEQNRQVALENEMARIKVPFRFSTEQSSDGKSSITKWTSLTGEDLETISLHFDINNVLHDQNDKRLTKIDALPVRDLKSYLVQLHCETKGKKADLVQRLKSQLPNIIKKLPKRGKINIELHTLASDLESSQQTDAGKYTLKVHDLSKLWTDFTYLYEVLKIQPGKPGYLSEDDFMERAKQWASFFRKVTFDEDITPYIHALVYHVPHFIGSLGYIHDLGTHKLEKKNHWHHRLFHQGTQRGGGKYGIKFCTQIMQYENRRCFALLHKLKRKKRKYTKRAARAVAMRFDRDDD